MPAAESDEISTSSSFSMCEGILIVPMRMMMRMRRLQAPAAPSSLSRTTLCRQRMHSLA